MNYLEIIADRLSAGWLDFGLGLSDRCSRASVASARLWRNVTLITFAHVGLIAGLIRWCLAESIVWLGGGEDLAAGEPETERIIFNQTKEG